MHSRNMTLTVILILILILILRIVRLRGGGSLLGRRQVGCDCVEKRLDPNAAQGGTTEGRHRSGAEGKLADGGGERGGGDSLLGQEQVRHLRPATRASKMQSIERALRTSHTPAIRSG